MTYSFLKQVDEFSKHRNKIIWPFKNICPISCTALELEMVTAISQCGFCSHWTEVNTALSCENLLLMSFLSIHSGLSDLLPPDAVGPLITSFLPFPSLSFQTPVMFLYYNILAGSLLFLWLISHYPWFPLELHDPFKNNGNNLTCACKPKVNKPKKWDSVVNEVLMLVNMRAKISSAMHTMAENCHLGWPFLNQKKLQRTAA